MKLLLENVRGFCGSHTIPIKRITFLVGENSTGKTTAMAALANALNPEFPTHRNAFSLDPFDLGTYDTIATYKGGKYGRADQFSVGFQVDEAESFHRLKASYVSKDGGVSLNNYRIERSDGEYVTCARDGDKVHIQMSLRAISTKTKQRREHSLTVDISSAGLPPIEELPSLIFRAAYEKTEKARVSQEIGDLFRGLVDLTSGLRYQIPKALSFAPLRTKPKRTYDQVLDSFRPEGDHVPRVLAKIQQNDSAEAGDKLLDSLARYGLSAGLFGSIRVKRLGVKPSDPFQVRVKSQGPDVNLTDVGYGVSQALPILVDTLTATGSQVLLVQQPEVHLHPRAQAEMGSFFVKQANEKNLSFVIETHSDYLVDRVRAAVRSGEFSFADVQILYFEKRKSESVIHQIDLDEFGNVLNAPPNYREFFLREEMLMMFGDSYVNDR